MVWFLFASRHETISGLDRAKHEGTKRKQKETRSGHQKFEISNERGRAPKRGGHYSPGRVGESVTDRVNPTLNRAAREIVGCIRLGQHGGLNTATSVVTHDDHMSDIQRLNSVRQNADRVVIDGLELVRDVPLGENGTWWCAEDRTLGNSRITNGPKRSSQNHEERM